MTVYTFEISGMHCASCGMLIDESVEDLAGVKRSQTSYKQARTVVEVDEPAAGAAEIVAAIAEAGYIAHQV